MTRASGDDGKENLDTAKAVISPDQVRDDPSSQGYAGATLLRRATPGLRRVTSGQLKAGWLKVGGIQSKIGVGEYLADGWSLELKEAVYEAAGVD